MSKRKDDKGRILKTGESQRKNGTYMYRYKTIRGERKSIYAKTLNELREKEKEVNNDIYNEVDLKNTTLYQALENLIDIKQCKIKPDSYTTYKGRLNKVKQFNIAHKPVVNITMTEAKQWVASLSPEWKYSHICLTFTLIKEAVGMLIDDRAIKYNPFDFSLTKILNNDKQEQTALTEEEEDKLLEFVKTHPNKTVHKNYLWMLLALETGMRISELWGLTVDDVDLEKNLINVNKQRKKLKSKQFYIETPKTKASIRQIPITKKLKPVLVYMINHRGEDIVIDGVPYSFICNTENDKCSSSNTYSERLNYIINQYNSTHLDQLPHISSHTLRHTFCTKLLRAGVNLKAVQNIMGHSKIDTSLNIYSHFDINDVQNEMEKLQ